MLQTHYHLKRVIDCIFRNFKQGHTLFYHQVNKKLLILNLTQANSIHQMKEEVFSLLEVEQWNRRRAGTYGSQKL